MATEQSYPLAVVVDATCIYRTSHKGGTVDKVPK
jgi:hypothetical protein